MPVNTIAVIGAGSLGRGIAHAAALAGYRTILEDILPNSLRTAGAEFRSLIQQFVSSGKISTAEADAAFARQEYAGSMDDAAREADLVIEAVPDEMESKLEIFTLLDKICRPGTIFVSNTLSLSISELASVTYRPGKCVAMRFTHPVHEMTRLEVVKSLDTDDSALTAALEVGSRMGIKVLVLEDSLAAISPFSTQG